MPQLPKLISPDDHLQAPPHLWQTRVPAKYRDAAPKLKRLRGREIRGRTGAHQFEESPDGCEADVWHYDGRRVPVLLIAAAAGVPRNEVTSRAMTFDEMRPGFYERDARLADMDIAGIAASVCYPNMFVRFCGQTFSLAQDKDVALACIRAYNDFIDEEWCAGSGGRLVPMGIVPLWDIDLAVQEARRIGQMGFRTISFSEAPHLLGLPSIFTGYWDPLFAECQEWDMVVSLHIGTGGFPALSPDGPTAVGSVMTSLNSANAITEWVFSGLLETYPRLKVCVAESQLGWIPYVLQRADFVWSEFQGEGFTGLDKEKVPHPPSFYFSRNIWCTFFRDPIGLCLIHEIGVDRVLHETDYPHTDTMWPICHESATEMTKDLTFDEAAQVLAENARRLFRVDVDPAATGSAQAAALSQATS